MDVFNALAEPTRRSIIEALAHAGSLSASEISGKYNVSPPAISQHLKVLREAGLVQVEKHAQQRIYSMNPEAVHGLEEWAREMNTLWNRRLDALEKVLEEEKAKAGKESGRKGNEVQDDA